MNVKFPFGDLNPDPFPSHPTKTYTCKVTIMPRVCSGYGQISITTAHPGQIWESIYGQIIHFCRRLNID